VGTFVGVMGVGEQEDEEVDSGVEKAEQALLLFQKI
jgi:hypothetical protein